jgi:AraC-like DNA-binding protein
MAELAAEVGHSISHLHREFRAQLGFTPMAWLARTRAEVAASLLVQTDRPVAWVGQQVGWPDPNYFSRCFRRAHGMSPTAYRARNASAPRDWRPGSVQGSARRGSTPARLGRTGPTRG